MRWQEPEPMNGDIDDPIRFDAGQLFIGVAVLGLVWVFIVGAAAFVILFLDVMGWRFPWQ